MNKKTLAITSVLLALFALGLVMQPLASALGELHGALAHGEGLSSPANHIDDGHDNADADHYFAQRMMPIARRGKQQH